ncbi:MAG: hypothetical protein ACRCRW_10685 [Aeromonadaceae bacterium]
MNAQVEARQQAQLAFIRSGVELVVGDQGACPLPPAELAALTLDSPHVVEHFGGGLTAQVLHLCIEGVHYTLKQKRAESLVRNLDGQTSFLNEVQRRADFTRLKGDPAWAGRFEHIVPTLYASLHHGIILSPWLPGKPLDRFDAALFRQILKTAVACEEAGLMEWDLCPGNIIDDSGHIWLFDFGYMYPFDPITQFNSNGVSDPLFHACERFETRNFFGWLLRQEAMSPSQALSLYRELKVVALELYTQKLDWLTRRGATLQVQSWVQSFITRWQQALTSEEALAALFELENFRSQVLDIEDDLHGQSCSAFTLRRLDFVEQCLRERFDALREGGALFYENAGKSQQQLLDLYAHKRQQVLRYQLA